ncbi:hypothetical protein HZB01_02360 [Candidatus Woesearchaeota archaeon]|nr:hypothetical protein [Candidatus Woesearchaeota archaeon]
MDTQPNLPRMTELLTLPYRGTRYRSVSDGASSRFVKSPNKAYALVDAIGDFFEEHNVSPVSLFAYSPTGQEAEELQGSLLEKQLVEEGDNVIIYGGETERRLALDDSIKVSDHEGGFKLQILRGSQSASEIIFDWSAYGYGSGKETIISRENSCVYAVDVRGKYKASRDLYARLKEAVGDYYCRLAFGFVRGPFNGFAPKGYKAWDFVYDNILGEATGISIAYKDKHFVMTIYERESKYSTLFESEEKLILALNTLFTEIPPRRLPFFEDSFRRISHKYKDADAAIAGLFPSMVQDAADGSGRPQRREPFLKVRATPLGLACERNLGGLQPAVEFHG